MKIAQYITTGLCVAIACTNVPFILHGEVISMVSFCWCIAMAAVCWFQWRVR